MRTPSWVIAQEVLDNLLVPSYNELQVSRSRLIAQETMSLTVRNQASVLHWWWNLKRYLKT